MIITIVPLLVAIIGLLMYLLASNAKVAEVGRIMFGCGLLAFMFATERTTVRIGSADTAPAAFLV
jgi:Na+/phosphate symporter